MTVTINGNGTITGLILAAANSTFTSSATGAVSRTVQSKLDLGLPLNPEDFGAVGDGTTDDISAFNAMWAWVKTKGGEIRLTPGKTYYLNSTWVIDVTNPVNWKLNGWGAQFKAGPSVTGYQIVVSGSFNEFQGEIEGCYFNHRGNGTAQGCIELKGAHCVNVRKNTVEMHSVKAGYTFIHLDTTASGSGEDDYNAFWCTIEKNSTRRRSGSESGTLTNGIKLTGACNATVIRDNTISNCDYGIYAEPATTTKTLANGVLIEGNAFETITTTAVHIQATAGQLGPAGWRVAFNRIESCPTFFSLVTGGAAPSQHSQPPLLMGNYCTNGSVTTWVNNPTSYSISVFETQYPGFIAVNNELWQGGKMTLRFPNAAGSDLYLQDASGSTDYTRGKVWFGNTFNIRVNPGDGKVYIKSGAPASGTDGTVVGTQT